MSSMSSMSSIPEKRKREEMDDGGGYSRDATKRLDAIIKTRCDQRNFPCDYIISLIANEGADPNWKCNSHGNRWTLLMWLSNIGKEEILGKFRDDLIKTFTFLLQLPNIDVTLAADGLLLRGCHLIHLIISMKDPVFLRILLSRQDGRSEARYAYNAEGFTALHNACEFEVVSFETICQLLEAGANPSAIARNAEARTPLQYLMMSGRDDAEIYKIVQKFCEYRAARQGLNVPSRDGGKTLLHYAVEYRRSKPLISILLINGAYPSQSIQDERGLTPEELAENVGNLYALAAMVDYLSRPSRAGG